MCLKLLMYHPYRPDEHQVSVLQRLESASEYIPLQPQIKTSYWTDALQHPTMSCQVRPSVLTYCMSILCLLVIVVMVRGANLLSNCSYIMELAF